MSFLPNCFFLDLRSTPIFRQLQIEEALLRASDENFCIINGSVSDSVVLGISRDPAQDLHLFNLHADNVPIIKRYSGGGTVFIDENTLMVSWIMNSNKVFIDPQELLTWSYNLYAPMFPDTFSVRENDYTLEEKKIGGNAQYIQKYRWVHHTTFLWDMNKDKLLKYLPIPKKQPLYRNQRSHENFLTKIRPLFPKKQDFFDQFWLSIQSKFSWRILSSSKLEEILMRPHRKASVLIETSNDI
ncbi:lipoate--protein ligase family protein [Chlamydia sp. 17-3921]|uniref:lipoate--protein ligase family protein n=1 Tax=Chlamydia sp. 17-3921 TaxID=2675798 RepID=UPI00191915CE|nr:lipoate--protein ligase family protein [Chlamydia sp. 17-3921]